MREFAKSVVSCTCAISMYGIEQVMNLLTPGQQGQGQKTAETLDKLIEVTTREMGEPMRTTFEAADKIQRGVVDLMFSGGPLAAPASGVKQGLAEVVRIAKSSGPSIVQPTPVQPAPPSASAGGWGPMP